jgi:hypothetical protein
VESEEEEGGVGGGGGGSAGGRGAASRRPSRRAKADISYRTLLGGRVFMQRRGGEEDSDESDGVPMDEPLQPALLKK